MGSKTMRAVVVAVTKHLLGRHDQRRHDPRQYPRTAHFPQSPGKTSDDVVISDVSSLLNTPIVASEKMDGANINMDARMLGVRGGDLTRHRAFNDVAKFYQQIRDKIPEGDQLAIEDVTNRHSVAYNDLPHPPHFLLNVLDTKTDTWLPDEDVDVYAEELGMPRPAKLFTGTLRDEQDLTSLVEELSQKPSAHSTLAKEGFVVRQAGPIPYAEFNKRVAKWVRPGHVQPGSEHWLSRPLVRNTVNWNKTRRS